MNKSESYQKWTIWSSEKNLKRMLKSVHSKSCYDSIKILQTYENKACTSSVAHGILYREDKQSVDWRNKIKI